jgi:hypothetical protein
MAVAYSPLFAALFFFVSTILRLISYMQFINRSFYNENDLKELNPIYVEQQWQYRRDNYPLIAGANVLNAVAWVLFAIPILQVSWILSRGGQRKMRTHGVIVGFALTGIITELIARFLLFGGRSTAVWVSTTFNLNVWLPPNISDQPDFIGWRALEVTYIIITGLVTFVDSFEWVCLFIILTLIAYSVSSMQNPALNIWWARFGLTWWVPSSFSTMNTRIHVLQWAFPQSIWESSCHPGSLFWLSSSPRLSLTTCQLEILS